MNCQVAPGTSIFEQPTFGYTSHQSYSSWDQGFNQRVRQKPRNYPRFRAFRAGSMVRGLRLQTQQTQLSTETRKEILWLQVFKFASSTRDTLSVAGRAATDQNSSIKTYQFGSEPVGAVAPSSTCISSAQPSPRTESRAPDECSGGKVRDFRSKGALNLPSAYMDSPKSLSEASSPGPTSPPPTAIARKKKEIVNNCMAIFEHAFDRWLDNLHNIGYGNGGVDGGSGPGSGGSGGGDEGRTNKRPVGQKRQLSEERDPHPDGSGNGDDNGDDNGDENRKGGGKRARLEENGDKRKFACPFFKHDPGKYAHRRTCCGPGWVSVHRMKEHLYRSHPKPKHACVRCYESFADDDLLKAHQRQLQSCEVSQGESQEGFDEAQERRLRERTRSGSEQKKWEEVYRILFPKEPVPSPYYDDDVNRSRKSGANDFAQYEQYLRREMPAIVRRKLEIEVETKLNCVQEELKEKAVEIFRDTALQLHRIFTSIDHRLSPSPEPEPDPAEFPGAEPGNTNPSPPPLEFNEIPDPSSVIEDPNLSELFNGADFDLEPFLYPEPAADDYDNTTPSSAELAYWSHPIPNSFVAGPVDNV